MTLENVRSAYQRHSRFYDTLFGSVLHSGRREAIERMDCQPGERVLEVGVGTGLSLPLYPWGVRVVGVDLSIPMLKKAKARAAGGRAVLAAMNAEHMGFADASFDKVVAMYVASVVPDPAALAREMRRVCRSPDGLYFVNHFGSRHPAVASAERLIAPLSGTLGFRPDFSLDRFLDDARLEVVETEPTGPLGYWTFLRTRGVEREAEFDRAA